MVAIIECNGVVATGNAIVRHAIATARRLWIYKNMLAPAHIQKIKLCLGALKESIARERIMFKCDAESKSESVEHCVRKAEQAEVAPTSCQTSELQR